MMFSLHPIFSFITFSFYFPYPFHTPQNASTRASTFTISTAFHLFLPMELQTVCLSHRNSSFHTQKTLHPKASGQLAPLISVEILGSSVQCNQEVCEMALSQQQMEVTAVLPG